MRRLTRALLPLALVAGLLPAAPAVATRGDFDVQAHRGGLGLTVESTIASFSHGLELGVSTLELDVQITQDGHAVVTHDRRIAGTKCKDTAPYTAGDPEFPYVGKYINTLSLKQVKQLDCGSQTLPNFPGQQPDPGAQMPELSDIFALVHRFHAYGVKLNIETKVEAGAPSETAPREQFVQVVAQEVRHGTDRPAGDDPELRLGRTDADAPGRAGAAAGRPDELRLPAGRSAGQVAVAGRDRHRRLRRRSGEGDQVLRRIGHLTGARLPAGRQGHRPDLPAVRHRRHGQVGARGRYEGRAVDGRRPGDHGVADRQGCRRDHHRLPRPAA